MKTMERSLIYWSVGIGLLGIGFAVGARWADAIGTVPYFALLGAHVAISQGLLWLGKRDHARFMTEMQMVSAVLTRQKIEVQAHLFRLQNLIGIDEEHDEARLQ